MPSPPPVVPVAPVVPPPLSSLLQAAPTIARTATSATIANNRRFILFPSFRMDAPATRHPFPHYYDTTCRPGFDEARWHNSSGGATKLDRGSESAAMMRI